MSHEIENERKRKLLMVSTPKWHDSGYFDATRKVHDEVAKFDPALMHKVWERAAQAQQKLIDVMDATGLYAKTAEAMQVLRDTGLAIKALNRSTQSLLTQQAAVSICTSANATGPAPTLAGIERARKLFDPYANDEDMLSLMTQRASAFSLGPGGVLVVSNPLCKRIGVSYKVVSAGRKRRKAWRVSRIETVEPVAYMVNGGRELHVHPDTYAQLAAGGVL